MIEQELASIIKFVLAAAEDPTPYYWNVPDSFDRPSIFFPNPEIETDGETFRTYRLDYTWFLKFFHNSTNEAHYMALSVLEAIKQARNLIPLIDENGEELTKGIRIREATLRPVDDSVVQLMIRFVSRRPYTAPDTQLMQKWIAAIEEKTGDTSLQS